MNLFGFSRTYKSARRLQQIVNVFLKHGFGRLVDQIHLSRYIPFRTRLRSFGQWPPLKGPTVPERLRMAFAELGPSFIKLAQILSSRPDLITAPFADELKKLQDEVPPFPVSDAIRTIEEELRTPIHGTFRCFDEVPVAAASIAQVHYATLLDGSEVIIKVQRPGIEEQIETDITIVSSIARLLDKYVPESRFFNPIGIVDEYSKTIRKELDFVNESRNGVRFRRNFAKSPDVYIPRIYQELVTAKVLVMERIKGVRIDHIEKIADMGLDLKKVARAGVEAYFKMVLEDGFLHADPHPGNMFVMADGRLGFVDFGIVAYVSPDLMETMANTFLAFIHRDFDRLMDLYIELGYVPEDVDMEAFRKEFRADMVDMLEPLYGLTLQEIDFARYLDLFTHLALRHRLSIPSDLLLVNKALLILESIGRELDPHFDFFAAFEPYAAKLARKRYSPSKLYEKAGRTATELGDFVFIVPKQLKQIVRKVLKDDFHIKMTHIGLDRLIGDMDRSSNRLAFGMIIAAILISSAIMHGTGVGPKIMGMSMLGFVSFGLAFILGIWLLISIIRSGRL